MVTLRKPPVTRKPPSSRKNDPRIARIAATIDRAFASPHRDELVLEVMGQILTFSEVAGEFGLEWSLEGARAVLESYAMNMPEDWLDEMANVAHDQLEWIAWWETEGRYEVKCTEDEWSAVKALVDRFGYALPKAVAKVKRTERRDRRRQVSKQTAVAL